MAEVKEKQCKNGSFGMEESCYSNGGGVRNSVNHGNTNQSNGNDHNESCEYDGHDTNGHGTDGYVAVTNSNSGQAVHNHCHDKRLSCKNKLNLMVHIEDDVFSEDIEEEDENDRGSLGGEGGEAESVKMSSSQRVQVNIDR